VLAVVNTFATALRTFQALFLWHFNHPFLLYEKLKQNKKQKASKNK